MQKNWKDSEFFKKLKHIRVNRAVYLSAIIVLLSISVVLIITAVNNRANKAPVSTTPPVSTTARPNETTPPEVNENDKPTQSNTLPEFALPVGGVLSQKHSVDTQVFSPTLNEYRVHLGIDIATEEAAPVFAMAAGTVAQIWEDPMMGWSVAISHTGDAVTVYKNLSKQFADGITVGAEVECIGISICAVTIRRLLVFDAIGLLRNLFKVKTAGFTLLGLHAFVQYHLIRCILPVRHIGNQIDVLIVLLQFRLTRPLGRALSLTRLRGFFGGLDRLFSRLFLCCFICSFFGCHRFSRLQFDYMGKCQGAQYTTLTRFMQV